MINFIKEWKDQLQEAECELAEIRMQRKEDFNNGIIYDSNHPEQYLMNGIALLKVLIEKFSEK